MDCASQADADSRGIMIKARFTGTGRNRGGVGGGANAPANPISVDTQYSCFVVGDPTFEETVTI